MAKSKAKSKDKLGSHFEGLGWERSTNHYTGGSYNLQSEPESSGSTCSLTHLSGGLSWPSESFNVPAASDWASCVDVCNARSGCMDTLPLTHISGSTQESDLISNSLGSPTPTQNIRYGGASSDFSTNQLEEASLSPLYPDTTCYDSDLYNPSYSTHNELMPLYASDNHHLDYTDEVQGSCSQSRPIKWHQLPKQSDPKREQKRLRAIKSRNDREKKKQCQQNLEAQLQEHQREVSELRLQKRTTEENIKFMEEEIDRAYRR
ncbi:hypothetical protein Pmani_035435 [Petrolisthes manimaculis]|uniref:BZIP domain-containing protein n=1 Tax=Petrolisthes manimaculis TaxID=1843537 RepID=A0AAE1NKU7_9EUCA|nr:hypothetical protein Pmani_035435 [Petrolisthes manimaculis]